MSYLLIFVLVSHIILGVLGAAFLVAYLLAFSKNRDDSGYLTRMSFFAFIAFTASWIFSGYYYVTYYGKAVKPIILKAEFSWAHTVLMESKEHIFLFLPFLSLALFAVTMVFRREFSENKKLSFSVVSLCFTTVSIALLVTIFGMVVSGAVAK